MKYFAIFFIQLFCSQIAFGQWTQTKGPEGGMVYRMVAAGNTVFAAANNHVFKSTDNGSTWTRNTTLGTSYSIFGKISALAVNGETILAASNAGFYRSTNNGTTWSLTGTLTNATCLLIAGTKIYAGVQGGVMVTSNNGTTWSLLAGSPVEVYTLFLDGTTIYAGGFFNDLYRSTNEGVTWTKVTATTGVTVKILKSGDKLYAATQSGGVFRSSDNGNTWSVPSPGLPAPARTVFALEAYNGKLYASSSIGIYASADEGANWTSVVSAGTNAGIVDCMAVSGTRLILGDRIGIRYTADGSTFTTSNTGLIGTQVIALASSTAGLTSPGIYAATNGSGVAGTGNNGTNWFPFNGGMTDWFITGLVGGANALYASSNNGVFRTTDGGFQWTKVGVSTIGNNQIRTLGSGDGVLYAGGYDGKFHSSTDGINWPAVSLGLTPDAYVTSISVVGTSLILSVQSNSQGWLRISTDKGATWSSIHAGLPEAYTSHVTGNAGAIYVATSSQGVYKSTNNGTTWTEFKRGLPEGSGNSLYRLAIIGEKIFLSSDAGIYVSGIETPSWSKIDATLPPQNAKSFLAIGNTLYAGTTTGVWSMPTEQIITSVSEKKQVRFEVFPNPARDQVTIRTLGSEGNKQVTLLDISGRIVKEVTAQHTDISIDVNNYSPGLYIIRVIEGNTTGYAKVLVE